VYKERPAKPKKEDVKRDPEEEFFMLAVLSLKMSHNEEYNDAGQYVYKISAAKLIREVRQNKMPFHKWYNWLEKQFLEFRDEFLKTQNPNDEGLDKWYLNSKKEKGGKQIVEAREVKVSFFDKI